MGNAKDSADAYEMAAKAMPANASMYYFNEAATLYKVHNQTANDTVDTQIWISKSRGLPLKGIYDIDVGGGARGKSHTEIRYEYTNVTAPAVTEPRRK